jgi:hypothetical protein
LSFFIDYETSPAKLNLVKERPKSRSHKGGHQIDHPVDARIQSTCQEYKVKTQTLNNRTLGVLAHCENPLVLM